MKKIDLYEIAIKILGLYLIVIILSQLRDLIVYFTVWTQQKDNPELFGNFDQSPTLIATGLGFVALTILSSILIFKTKQIAKLICRKNDFEDDITLFAERKTIYEISLVLLGLVTIVLTLPDFIYKLKNHINFVQANLPTTDYDKAFLMTSGIKIGIGLIAIIYSTEFSNILTKRRKKNEPVE
ncbi:hypothetical protein [Confluentibacter citreus]|uniref:hypothetical protein n=1 Tax=Confluentibacter citreus TaxID=2007307 RepID=UPI0012FD910B|nr:hypothetical protein [Confluentibacter citreus]